MLWRTTPDGQLSFILALKVCEGEQDIAHNVYTGRLQQQAHCFNRPHGGPGERGIGNTKLRQPPAWVCSNMCQLLTDRQTHSHTDRQTEC